MAAGEFFGELVAEFIGRIVFGSVLKLPGAAVRWMFLHNTRTFRSLVKDPWVNTMTSLLLIGIVIAISIFISDN